MESSSPYRSGWLKEGLLPAGAYNNLPFIDDVHLTAEHEIAKQQLLQMILEHNVGHLFTIRIIHKHYDVPQNKVMVHETVYGPPSSVAMILTSKSPYQRKHPLRGKNFMAEPDGTFQAYEYTVDPIQDVSKQQVAFLECISREILRLGVEQVFALTVLGTNFFEEFVEFEVPQLQATIALRPSIWLPQYKKTIQTQWIPTYDSSSTGKGGHCVNQAGTHTAVGYEGPLQDLSNIHIAGTTLAPGTEAFEILRNAMQAIAVTSAG
ncbi:hypothetical protein ASPVEDRAFT_365779 [Aspergillus versicolor CBS 583.65]|uniref:Uncharacterized protein n=1 Tax=Aspergillus versicolor CBS 583.65 TaxID=1036611 RepID=A0A1L9Q0U3_ASPVE|nr:uncharacterized protein ASPVEDRAFT_365779 [Aspergillus versicolor CBS 583.65]OJJ07397.1 hypothetical protein ASPVEDRAFT_365779 [Aspergillus versicolor CBS 583.65]